MDTTQYYALIGTIWVAASFGGYTQGHRNLAMIMAMLFFVLAFVEKL